MNSISGSELKIQSSSTQQAGAATSGTELETLVATSLVGDLNQQLADISDQMKRQLEEKKGIRGELEAIYSLKRDAPVQDIDGVKYVDLSAAQAQLLGVTQKAMPLASENGEVRSYRLKEEEFLEAAKSATELRESRLEGLNSNHELTMIKVQSLIEQRKNAMTLLSNLLAAAGEVAKTIIGNIRG